MRFEPSDVSSHCVRRADGSKACIAAHYIRADVAQVVRADVS